jgi:flagellar assembly factor FliW
LLLNGIPGFVKYGSTIILYTTKSLSYFLWPLKRSDDNLTFIVSPVNLKRKKIVEKGNSIKSQCNNNQQAKFKVLV